MTNKTVLLLVVLVCVTCGCQSTFGPRALQRTHPAYNEAITKSLREQLLLNLVRLRYRDSPSFLEIASVTASLSLSASAGAESEIDLGPGGNIVQPQAGIEYSQSPTISYAPLRGEDFLKSVLSSISLEALLVMTQSGWSISRVFGICIERMNNLYNAPSASGPAPEDKPERYRRFARALSILRTLQREGLIEIGPNVGADGVSSELVILLEPHPDYQSEISELQSLLGFSATQHQFAIDTNFLDRSDDKLDVRVRSIMSVLFYLSQNVHVPDEHKVAGLVSVTRADDGGEFDWGDTPAGRHFAVHWSKEQPGAAFIAVPYRGFWFYIEDNDLQTKSSFLLVQQLFSLQAGQSKAVGPTLTIPVGG
jgi:hypothetical protein